MLTKLYRKVEQKVVTPGPMCGLARDMHYIDDSVTRFGKNKTLVFSESIAILATCYMLDTFKDLSMLYVENERDSLNIEFNTETLDIFLPQSKQHPTILDSLSPTS